MSLAPSALGMGDAIADAERATTRLPVLVGELAALARLALAMPSRALARDTLHLDDRHPVPVVLVHGMLGDATNFAALRAHLARHGIRRFASFRYLPRLDFPHLAARLAEHVEAVRRDTGAAEVDVVGHSLGGVVARYLAQTDGERLVRRLVTLGAPYLAQTHPRQELAVFGTHDPIVPPPADRVRRHAVVVDGCGHLGLLADPRALDAVTRWLRRPRVVAGRAVAA